MVNHAPLDHYLDNLEDKLAKAAQVANLKFTRKHSGVSSWAVNSWKLLVLDIDSENAFFAGDNVILLTKGLLRNLQNEAELAAIVAHEMSHSLLGHVLQSPRPPDGHTNAPQYYFSIGNEIAADVMSTHILELAAYDISHALTALDIIYRQNQRKPFSENADWVKKRQAMLLKLIATRPQPKYSISNTREFARMKRYLNRFQKVS